MLELFKFKPGFFPKLLSTIILIIIYMGGVWITFYSPAPLKGSVSDLIRFIGVFLYFAVHIPIGIFIAAYIIYSFTASHKTSFLKWLNNND